MAQSVAILGSTGSVGVSTLEVLALHPQRYSVFALSANTRHELLAQQCRQWEPQFAVMQDPDARAQLSERLKSWGVSTIVLQGERALEEIVEHSSVDVVVAAIVGAAGLLPTMAAAKAGKRLLLANKEALVMSGQLLMQAARSSGALVLPLDSEHNAIFQCLPKDRAGSDGLTRNAGISKILLTASGGPFRGYTKKQLSVVSRQQALNHPNWSMGPKISIDSATLMNKGLEVIEACYLFDLNADDIQVVVHPESVIHSMVSYVDGSVIAQLGRPDMRTPIAHALAWPERIASGVKSLDLFEVAQLNFEPADHSCFPCLGLAFAALAEGGTAPTILNAANEVAVESFLSERVSFLQLSQIVEESLERAKIETADDLETIISADAYGRHIAHTVLAEMR